MKLNTESKVSLSRPTICWLLIDFSDKLLSYCIYLDVLKIKMWRSEGTGPSLNMADFTVETAVSFAVKQPVTVTKNDTDMSGI